MADAKLYVLKTETLRSVPEGEGVSTHVPSYYYNCDFTDNNTTLDKMIQLENSKNKVNVYKVILLIAGCLAMLILLVALCIIFYKNQFSFESLLSLLLAFFSIFISIFFYFKADETSNRFYDTSYDFMKEVSVTLGKIEERFGEKLNSLNDKISHLSVEKEEKKEELQTVEDEKQKVINELLDKAKLDASQKEAYLAKLREKEVEADSLRRQLANIDMKYKRMMRSRESIYSTNEPMQVLPDMISRRDMSLLAHTHPSDWPGSLKRKMIDLDFMTPDGELTPKGEILFEGLRSEPGSRSGE